jgi:predicted deacylase
MRLPLVGAVLLVSLAPEARALDFDRYHDQQEINAYMAALAHDDPALVTMAKLGDSEQGRPINYVVITKVADPATAPALYLNGTHHGDEWSSTETTLGLIDRLTRDQNEPAIDALLRRYVLVVQPLVNPDGHAASTREEPRGRDPNRDYAYPRRADAASFHIPIIQLVKGLTDRYHFKAAVAYHSGEESVLWPWCYTGGAATDRDLFYTLAKRAADVMGFRSYQQSYDDYPTTGEFVDYVYMKDRTLALTIEVSTVKTPDASALAEVVERGVAGTLAFLDAVAANDRGGLVLEPAPPASLQVVFNPRYVALGKKLE